jgi:hypothetical protein
VVQVSIRPSQRVLRGVRAAIALVPALLACGSAEAPDALEHPGLGEAAAALTGNGAPSGSHFNLNMIGVKNQIPSNITTGGRIFVPLSGSTKILLSEGADFAVLDANGTDGSASFQLPNPDPDGDGTTSFSVFARSLGKPGGSASVTTCATDPTTGEQVCSLDTLVAVRSSGKQRFTNVSKELLFVNADLNGDGVAERVSLFDDQLQNFFWQFDNQGLRLLQLRFYPVATTVP